MSRFQDYDKETLDRIGFQNQVQTMLEEIEFMRRVHDQVCLVLRLFVRSKYRQQTNKLTTILALSVTLIEHLRFLGNKPVGSN